MRKFLPQHVITVCSKQSAPNNTHPELPFAELDGEGIAAVIDISGFTALTTSLLEKHGADGAAVLREALKTPFLKIIERIYARSGAIVKFAGDAAIACWSIVGSGACRLSREYRIIQPFVCGLELLGAFRQDPGMSKDALGIHIGIGIGKLHHIHVGHAANSNGEDRREYFIAGGAVSEAGTMVSFGNRGYLVMTSTYYDVLVSALAKSPVVGRLRMLAKETKLGKGSVHLISDNSSQFDSTLVYFIKLFPDEVPVTEDEFIDRTMAISYIETSIASFIKMSDYKVNLDQENYSDTRNATVVFLRFQNIQIGLGMNDSQTQPFVQSADLMRVHKISLEIIRCVHAEGGSLRQINVDDKGFTALAVWGLRGLAHQRGEAVYALSACINIFNGLNDGGEARSHFAFTAGVASGTVYAGLIGSDLRADGTVLGSPVNTAARMMCLEEPEWSTTADFPLIYCDTATYENARKEFEFLQDTRSVELKGFSSEVRVYQVKGERRQVLIEQPRVSTAVADDMFGRSAEQRAILAELTIWKMASQRRVILITGRSGLGKSSLLKRVRSELAQYQPIILCECTGDEVKQRMSFGGLVPIFRSISSQLQAAGVHPEMFRTARDRSLSIMTDRKSPSAAVSESSLLPLPDSLDTTWTYLAKVIHALGIPRATSRLLAVIPGLKAFSVHERLPGVDLTGEFAIIIHQILEVARFLGFESCLICDDIQWLDSESHKVLNSLMKFSQSTLLALGGRTREEWEQTEWFDIYRTSSTFWMELDPLPICAVEEMVRAQLGRDLVSSLCVDIFNKTSGVPIAVHVAIMSLKSANERYSSNPALNLVLDKEKAISAQMDLLAQSFQTTLAVASIIGQNFDLDFVADVLSRLGSDGSGSRSAYSASDLETQIENHDRFGFLTCKSIERREYAFRHYLVQQGVLSTLLPKRRESIHRAALDALEVQLRRGGDDRVLLPVIIRHVLSISDEIQLKSSYLHRGFLMAGKDMKLVEAMYYIKTLDSIHPDFEQSLCLADRLNHFRVLSSLYYETGDFRNTWVNAGKLLQAAGFNVPTKVTAGLACLLYHIRTVLSLRKVTAEERVRIGCAYLHRTFPTLYKECLSVCTNRFSARKQSRGMVGEAHFIDKLATYMEHISSALEFPWNIYATGVGYVGPLEMLLNQTSMISVIILSTIGLASGKAELRSTWAWPYKLSLNRFIVPDEIFTFSDCIRKAQLIVNSSMPYMYGRMKPSKHYLLRLQEALLCYKDGGLEFGAAPMGLLMHMHQIRQLLGSFDPEIPESMEIQIDQAIEYFSKRCPHSLPILTLKLCEAIQAAMLCKSFYLKTFCHSQDFQTLFDEMKRCGLPLSNATVVLGYARLVILSFEMDSELELTEWLSIYSDAADRCEQFLIQVTPFLIPASAYAMLLFVFSLSYIGLRIMEPLGRDLARTENIRRFSASLFSTVRAALHRSQLAVPQIQFARTLTKAVAPLFNEKISRPETTLLKFAALLERGLHDWADLLCEAEVLVIRARRLQALWLSGGREVQPEIMALMAKMERYDLEWERANLKNILVQSE